MIISCLKNNIILKRHLFTKIFLPQVPKLLPTFSPKAHIFRKNILLDSHLKIATYSSYVNF